ncbi:MAG: helix-turn-helix transcriptional regulator [Oscillospiraceae bacterium]|nr:helix-turn-helix transcriptional regulator [Oscillospiraceae bacterium]
MVVPEYKAYYKNLGQNISFYRRRREISQETLAEIVNLHNVHMSRIETGTSAPSLDTVFAIADALGVEPYKLFQDKE